MYIHAFSKLSTKRTFTALGVLAATALLAAGCGGDDDSSSDDSDSSTTTTQTESTETETTGGDEAATGAVIEVAAVSGELKFDKTELTGTAGKVTLKFTNPDTIPHNIAVKNGDKTFGESELITEDTVELTVDLEAGEYEFYCTPHEGAGMKGTLTIT